jgi:hypothetical protein
VDTLTVADMTPAGQPVTLAQRIEEVQRRYRSDDPVHRAIVRARPLLQAGGRATPSGPGTAPADAVHWG